MVTIASATETSVASATATNGHAQPEVTHLRTCPLCEAMCGLEITVRGEAVTRIRPRKEDVFSKGHICPKGTTLGALHSDPTRLRAPVVRDGDGFREVSWEEAFATCERLIHRVVAEHGIDAVTAYVGNPAAHTFSIGRYIGVLIGMCRDPAHLLGGNRRPVAEERHRRTHVRRHVDHPRAGRPAQRLHGPHGRESAGVARVSDGLRQRPR